MASVLPRLYIAGAGGIGCAVGYALRARGTELIFVDSSEEKVRTGNEHGVEVKGHRPLAARFVLYEDWKPEPGATVLLCTKCYRNTLILAKFPTGIAIVPIQNGFDSELDARGHGWECIASFVSECDPRRPVTRITRPGRLYVGPRHTNRSAMAFPLAERLRGTELFSVKPVRDIVPYKYTKLMYNAAISPLAAASGIDNGDLLRLPKARRLFFHLLQENYTILRRANVPLERIGPCRPATVARILARPRLASALAWAFYPTLRGTYCSMSADIRTGVTEVDYYNGHLLRLAGDVPCPLNRQVYTLIKQMERERIRPSIKMLDRLE